MARKTRAQLIIEAQKRGESSFREFNESLADLGKKAALAGAAAAAGLAALTARSFSTIDALAKTSDKLGIATEDLASLRLAGELTGVEAGKLELGLQRMTRRIAEVALTGRGEAAPALRELGLSVEELAGLDPAAQFEKVAEAMGTVESQSARVALGFKLFDSEGVDLIRTLERLDREGFAEVREEAERLGLAVSRFDAAKIEQANDAVTLLKGAAEGVGNVIATEAAPLVTALSNAFLQSGLDAQTMAETVRAGLDLILRGVGLVADAFYGWQLIFAGTELGIKKIELALSRAQDSIRDFLGTSQEALERQRDLLEQTFEIQARGLPPEARERLRETFDQQIAALDVDRSKTAELETQAFLLERSFAALAQSEKPSEALARNIAEARAESDRLAQRTAELAEQRTFVPPDIDVSETPDEQRARERAAREEAAARERLERELETVRQGTLLREEVEREAITRRLEVLRTAYEEELITQERFYELAAKVAEDGQDRLTEITAEGLTQREKFEAASAKEKTAFILDSLTSATAGVAQNDRRLFEINKAAAIGTAIVNTAQGITEALALGPIIGIPLAAVMAAAGYAQIQAIRNTQFGGGTTPSAAGTTPVINETPVAPTVPSLDRDSARDGARVEVIVQGSVIGMGGAEELVDFIQESLRDRIDNRDEIIYSSTSRQAAV
jgi:hypothetical protein